MTSHTELVQVVFVVGVNCWDISRIEEIILHTSTIRWVWWAERVGQLRRMARTTCWLISWEHLYPEVSPDVRVGSLESLSEWWWWSTLSGVWEASVTICSSWGSHSSQSRFRRDSHSFNLVFSFSFHSTKPFLSSFRPLVFDVPLPLV